MLPLDDSCYKEIREMKAEFLEFNRFFHKFDKIGKIGIPDCFYHLTMSTKVFRYLLWSS